MSLRLESADMSAHSKYPHPPSEVRGITGQALFGVVGSEHEETRQNVQSSFIEKRVVVKSPAAPTNGSRFVSNREGFIL